MQLEVFVELQSSGCRVMGAMLLACHCFTRTQAQPLATRLSDHRAPMLHRGANSPAAYVLSSTARVRKP